MSKLIVMCGLPASGKSTLAKNLSEQYNATILSSDEIREELLNDVNDQNNNTQVFEVMNSRAKKLLDNNQSVIYDATNINRKRRRHLINHVLKADEKVVYYLNNTLRTIKYRNETRSRTVPEEVIDRMYKNLHMPVENEGWDKVIYTRTPNKYLARFKNKYEDIIQTKLSHDRLLQDLGTFIYEFKDIYNLPQDSSYHSFSVSRHTYYVYLDILNNYHEEDKLAMLWASLFHDIGKAFCKSFVNFKGEVTRFANFTGHEFVGSQVATSYLDLIGYDDEFIKSVATLVQFHMVPMKANEKKLNETRQLIGDDLFEKLMILHEADINAK